MTNAASIARRLRLRGNDSLDMEAAATIEGLLGKTTAPVSGPRVLVCGGRSYAGYARLSVVLDHYHASNPFSCLIHGAYRGADTLADTWAKSRGVPVLPFPADWQTYGNSAGPLRNARMLAEGKPTLVIAFPGGSGTADMCKQARRQNVPVLEVV